ncbi:MAG: DUF4214 domain-containing protein [Pseudomonadota bacterium]
MILVLEGRFIFAADRIDGPYTQVSSLERGLDGIAFAPDGTLYAFDNDLIGTVDLLQSAFTPIARSEDVSFGGIDALVIAPSGEAFATHGLPGLFSVDLETGALSLIPGTDASIGSRAELTLLDGSLFAATLGDELVQFDLETSAELSRATFLIDDIDALVADDGRLFTYADQDIFEIDPETAAATLIVEGFDALARNNAPLSFRMPTDTAEAPGTTGQGLSVALAQEVAYVYEAGLDRDGDIDRLGLNFWIDQREAGLSRRDLADAFLQSAEFEAAFGDPDALSDRLLIERLYLNVLDRDGEEAGILFWESVIAEPGFGRNDLLLAFAGSAENVSGSPQVEDLAELAPGIWDFVS